ncbi:MAG: hypothetical protein JNG90_01960 [Planctomycetaceae bacterium]|nr:hypothetical protein [Planctomycetaceae bacterium]
MRSYLILPLAALSLAALGCEPEMHDSHPDGASTTITAPAPAGGRTDIEVRPGGNVDVDVDSSAAPADRPVQVDVTPGGGVDVDVNPEAVGERLRERREARQEAREEAAETP